MLPYSLLDLAPIPEGETVATSLANTLDLAPHAEALGYHRYWLAEHHNMAGIASSATAVLIGQVLAATSTMRVGSGGIMLPNHAPLVVAEAFGTLASLYPDRVDLGLGRAPGTDAATMHALRRARTAGADFPEEVAELLGYLGDPQPGQRVRAVPGAGTHVPVWILGSSLFGAQLAAHLGLPYAFASHFAPAALADAAAIYRDRFQPQSPGQRAHFMLAVNVFGADTTEEARYLRTSVQQAFANLSRGRPGPLPAPVEDIDAHLTPQVRQVVDEALSCSATGNPDEMRAQLAALIERHKPDEVIFSSGIHDHAARKRSYAIAAQAMQALSG